MYPPKEARRDEDGVITEPRNFFTKKVRTGKADDIYFQRPSYLATGDPFKAAALGMTRTSKKDGHLEAGHDKVFSPAKVPLVRVPKAPFPYQPLGPGPKKEYKDEEGTVIVGPKNILTNPIKVGKVGRGTSFGGKVEYMTDDYDAKKKIAAEERQYHLTKVQEKPFSQRAKHTEYFSTHR